MALEQPIGSSTFQDRLARSTRVCILIPDETRKDVFGPLWPILKPLLNDKVVSVGIAAGKHAFIEPPEGMWRHDVSNADLVDVGYTSRGTRVCYPKHVIEADLRILIGEIRPHYFAGYAGGAKTLFPGVAGVDGIWANHELKASPGARLGQVEHNPCRADMEEAAELAGPSFIINVIRAPNGSVVDIVAGHPIEAHREGVRRARPVFECDGGPPARMVVISDGYPVTMNLYQACKPLPPAGAVLKEGGTIVLAAQCGDGIGPVDVINEAIYRLGSVHSLPRNHRVILVSERSPKEVQPTFAEYAETVKAF